MNGGKYMSLNKIQKEMLDFNPATKEEIDGVTSLLAHSATIQLSANVADTSYIANQKIDVEYIRQRQSVLYGTYVKKFRRKEAVKIVTQGDSLTYGHDTVSADKRPADTSPNSDGVVHTQTRASVTYPEALLTRLQYINPLTTLENRGYSGDSVQDGYSRWKSKSNANLTIIDYGINDAQSYSNINGDLDAYFYWYEQLVIKTILQGSAVAILSPTKINAAGNVGLDISSFRKSLSTFAKKYNLPIIDGHELLRNYDNSIFTDTVHLNGKGYNILGTRVAAALLNTDLHSPLKVTVGNKLLTNIQRDNIYTVVNTTIENSGDAPTPSETTTNEAWGTVANIKQDGEILYSFYADTDDLIVIPYFQISGDLTATIELDFGIEQPRTSIASSIDRTNMQKVAPSTATKALTGAWKNINKLSALGTTENLSIVITTKGWHTVKIKNINTASKSLFLHGLEFAHFDTLKSLVVTNKTTLEASFYKGVFYPTYAPPFASITQTKVKLDDLKKLLNFDYAAAQSGNTWNDTPLRITIYNSQQSILTYTFVIGYNTDSRFLSPVSRINIATTPTERTLSTISVDWTAKELILNWGGDTARVSSFQISVA
jgi:lysophospholipase L1-like esterase